MKKIHKLLFVTLLLINFFVIPLVANISGILLPFWKDNFHLSATIISILGAILYLASGLTALPQSALQCKIGNKSTLIAGCAYIFTGSIIFWFFPVYKVGIFCLFLMGAGITALNMSLNLLVKSIDHDPAKYSQNLTAAQTFASLGAASGGLILNVLMKNLGFDWRSIYLMFAILTATLIIAALTIPFPNDKEVEQEACHKAGLTEYLELLKTPYMIALGFGMFIYAGIEFGIASWISSFMISKHSMTKLSAANIVSLFWFLQATGRFIGGYVFSKIQPAKVFTSYAITGFSALFVATLAPNLFLSALAFVVIGFSTSIMFPYIFFTATNAFEKRHETAVGGILCTSMIGGSLLAPIIGFLSDVSHSLTFGLILVGSLSFLYLTFVGFLTLKKASQQVKA